MWRDADVLENAHLADRYWSMRLAAPEVAGCCRPGQFVMVTVGGQPGGGLALPRPMAVHATDPAAGTIEIIYGLVGAGTRHLSTLAAPASVGTLGPLGRPFEPPGEPGRALLLSRGIGVCSLSLLGLELLAAGWQVLVVASGRTPDAVVGIDRFVAAGIPVISVSDAGGDAEPAAVEQRVLTAWQGAPPDYVAACGSRRLEELAATYASASGAEVQVALEAPMACGLGYCHGCSTGTQSSMEEAPLVCRDGPVFRYETGRTFR
ncbi:hypothetical protein [Nonomuraea sp. NPDC050691]|uniref:iron-sulfur cluster-binding protein n=1 Tax=Nonomuraea sp. NPDC050691 TaxID=3155661 RepID=UPI0033C83702